MDKKRELYRKTNYTYDDLVDIMDLLMAPDGCPWDRVQTHQSIKMNLIEEAYELVDAIDSDITDNIVEESGDLLLQAVFHAKIGERDGRFGLDDVINALCRKLVTRHVHIFGTDKAADDTQALNLWEKAKTIEKSQSTVSKAIADVPKGFPQLLRAYKVQKKAAKVGFDYADVTQALDALESEIAELRAEIAKGDNNTAAKELGDCLFSAVNVARFIGAEPELVLMESTDKFATRFEQVEKMVAQSGKDFAQYTAEQLDVLYRQTKEKEKNKD